MHAALLSRRGEGSAAPRGSLPAMSDTTIVITIILVIITIVTITEFFLLAAYIVYKTGATTGIADIGRAVAAIIAAITNNPEP